MIGLKSLGIAYYLYRPCMEGFSAQVACCSLRGGFLGLFVRKSKRNRRMLHVGRRSVSGVPLSGVGHVMALPSFSKEYSVITRTM